MTNRMRVETGFFPSIREFTALEAALEDSTSEAKARLAFFVMRNFESDAIFSCGDA